MKRAKQMEATCPDLASARIVAASRAERGCRVVRRGCVVTWWPS